MWFLSNVREILKPSSSLYYQNDTLGCEWPVLYLVFASRPCLHSDPASWWEQCPRRKSGSLPRWPVGHSLWWPVGWCRCWSCLSAAWPWVCFSTCLLLQQQSRSYQTHSWSYERRNWQKNAPLKPYWYFRAVTKFISRRFRYSGITFNSLEPVFSVIW